MRKIKKAIVQAMELHAEQKRKGKDIPYITHPLTVGLILARAGADEDTVVAGLLHDTIEDSIPERQVTREMLSARFGERVADIVLSVTEQNKELSWEERKAQALAHIATFSHESLLVKSADVISNASEIVEDYEQEGEALFARFNAPKEKLLRHYLQVITALIGQWAENPLNEDLRLIARKLQSLGAAEVMREEKPAGLG